MLIHLEGCVLTRRVDNIHREISSQTFQVNNFALPIKKLPSAYLRENISITTSGLFSTPPLRCALEELGEDRVLFSVDYPYESSKDARDWLDNVDF